MVPRVFSVPGWGVFSSQIRVWCSRNGVLGAHGCFQFPEWCFRFPARGDGMAVFVVPVRCFWFPCVFLPFFVASSCFFLLLCFLLLPCFFPSFLPSFLLSSFPPLLPCFLSFFFPFPRSCLPPSFPASSCPSFVLSSVLPFLASCPCFLPFPSLPFPFLSLPFPSFPFPSFPFPSLPFLSLPFPNSLIP